jgi:anti-anti-sigma factor
MATNGSFYCEVDESPNDQKGNRVTTVKCHGRILNENAGAMKDAVKPLIQGGGRIILDLTDVSFMDSSGLGALVSLKATAINQGLCRLELVNLTPRVVELLSMTGLKNLFAT